MSSDFFCDLCLYSTDSKFNFARHLLSIKHLENEANNCNYVCECGKRFKKNNGLWKHKKKCEIFLDDKEDEEKEVEEKDDEDSDNDSEMWKDMVYTLVNKNTEWQNKYEELQNSFIEEGKEFRNAMINMQSSANITNVQNIQNIQNIQNTQNTQNTQNIQNTKTNTFNLNFFLNETCKDAMNIDDFIDSIQITIDDLKNLAKNGYVEGMSNLFIKNLEQLDVTKRPLHCSDLKRESIYIRDKNLWNKGDNKKKRLTKIATDITRLNTTALQGEYQKKYPHCLTDTKSKEHDEYGKIAYEAFGGKIDIDKANKKLFHNIMKYVVIDKNNFV